MALHDPQTHRQPEARAADFGLGREERFEDAVQVLRRNPRAGIRHLHLHHGPAGLGPDGERPAAVLHDVDRVVDEVQEHLLDAGHVDLHGSQPRRVFLPERHRVQGALPAHHGQRLLEHRVEIGDLRDELALPAEVQEVPHDVAGAPRLFLDEVELLAHRLARRDLLGEVRGEAEHARQGIVDLVGDIRRQLADRRELRGLDQLRLRPLELDQLLLLAFVQP